MLIKRVLACFTFSLLFSFMSCMSEDNLINDRDNEIIIQLGSLSGEDGFWALYNAHVDALNTGKKVRYSGEKINITIPDDAKSIPLTDQTNFGGTTITVENKSVDGFFLFTLMGEAKPISINQNLLGGGGDFTSVQELNKGTVLLLLGDDNPWVKKRKGYSYGATRQDVLLLYDGVAQNEPVMPWDNPETTKPKITYAVTDQEEKVIRNLVFERTPSSTVKTMLVRVEYQNNVLLDNITVNTPENGAMYGDYVIRVYNSTNVTVKDVSINGTYSQENQYGYGLNMLNDYNSHFIRLKANGKWGVFGTNNMNKVILEDSNVNRFDIHCYGKDVTMKNVTFENHYNQFSSIYGTIRYENCLFKNHTPYLAETSYNCFTPFTLEISNCIWEVPSNGIPEALCVMGSLTDEYNERLELNERSYPNVYIDGLKVITPSPNNKLFVFWHNENILDTRPVENIKEVLVNNLVLSEGTDFELWNCYLNTSHIVDFYCKE